MVVKSAILYNGLPKETISFGESARLGFATLFLACLIMLVFAFEGMICILMSLPILAILTLLGIFIGYKVNKKTIINKDVLIILVGSTLFFMSYDSKTIIK